jgi:hypothetical protein
MMSRLSAETLHDIEKRIDDMREEENRLAIQVLQTQLQLDELRLKMWKEHAKLDKEKREE